jgi:hypothetical protein
MRLKRSVGGRVYENFFDIRFVPAFTRVREWLMFVVQVLGDELSTQTIE